MVLLGLATKFCQEKYLGSQGDGRFAKTMPNVCWSPYPLLYKMKWQGTWSIEFWSHTIREFWKPLERICAASETWTLEVSQELLRKNSHSDGGKVRVIPGWTPDHHVFGKKYAKLKWSQVMWSNGWVSGRSPHGNPTWQAVQDHSRENQEPW